MQAFDDLMHIMDRLRGPGGCPWDAAQDHKTIAHCAIEEAYELVDAIMAGDDSHMEEELGDLLLQVVFHATIAKDRGAFGIEDVITRLKDKLIHRHPHVFADAQASDAETVKHNWEVLKLQEKGKDTRKGIFDGIPAALPSLLMARKLVAAAKRVGHGAEDMTVMAAKIQTIMHTMTASPAEITGQAKEDLIGQMLFSTVQMAQNLGIDTEIALHKANQAFKLVSERHYPKKF